MDTEGETRGRELKKMEGKGYIRTDLAYESVTAGIPGVTFTEYESGGFPISETRVTERSSRVAGIPAGTFVTVSVGKVWLYGPETVEKAANAVLGSLRILSEGIFGSAEIGEKTSVMAVCLGNRSITSDAVGPLCAEKLTVTRHLKTAKPELFESLGGREISVVVPGVTGDTGIETAELIKAACGAVKPSLVICVDALAARSPDRLMTSVQLTDTGISPGSGVGNRRSEISRRTLGVPVISIGVPTVVQSATLVYDALRKANIRPESGALAEVLENGRSFFVTPKDADIAVRAVSEVISETLNKFFRFL